MSALIMLVLAALAGIAGGLVNYHLPGNLIDREDNPNAKKKYRNKKGECILLGIGATLMIPVFLELGQSKLMDGIKWQSCAVAGVCQLSTDPDTVRVNILLDSARKAIRADTFYSNRAMPNRKIWITVRTDTASKKITGDTTSVAATRKEDIAAPADAGKNYVLWFAYCMVAATAGFQFINMIVSRVITSSELNKWKEKSQNQEEVARLNKMQDQKNFYAATVNALSDVSNSYTRSIDAESVSRPFILPNLLPVRDPDDIQKGRFGGSSERNNRVLSAIVKKTGDPEFFTIHFKVEGKPDYPLNSSVLFFLHDTFHPPVINIGLAEIQANNGIAEYTLEAWGAFTIGAVTDFGSTLLELDLSEQKEFPEKFRSR